MKAYQLPLSNLNNISIDGYPDFIVISGNSVECAKGAIAIAKATGSLGATEIHRNMGIAPEFKNLGINKFAIVKKIKL